MAAGQMAIAEQPVGTAQPRTEGELSISLSEMLGLLGTLEAEDESDSLAAFEGHVRDNVKMAVADKLRRYQGFFSFCEAQSGQCDAEIERLQNRKRAIVGAKERLRKYLARAMELHGVKRLDAGTVVFTLQPGRPSLPSDLDASKVPGEYLTEEIVCKIDRPALKRALEAGTQIEGVELTVGDPFIVAR